MLHQVPSLVPNSVTNSKTIPLTATYGEIERKEENGDPEIQCGRRMKVWDGRQGECNYPKTAQDDPLCEKMTPLGETRRDLLQKL